MADDIHHQQSAEERQLEQLNRRVDQLYQDGQYQEAISLASQICDFTNFRLGNPFAYFDSLKRLAWLYESTDKPAQAEEVYQEALNVGRLVRGENHPDYASILNSLGLLAYTREDYAQAKLFFQQALEIRRTALGENHPEVATSLDNLGGVYFAMGNYALAEPLMLQALRMRRATLDGQDPALATSLNNLGGLYSAMGKYVAAEPFYIELLEICRRTSGEDDPLFAGTLDNLGEMYTLMGNYAAAGSYYKELIEILRRTLGEDDPRFVKSLDNLAAVYRSMGNYSAALPLMQHALDIERKRRDAMSGLDVRLENLANVYWTMGDYAEAKELSLEALEIRYAIYGEKHPNIAQSLNDLATIEELSGNYAEAEAHFRQALHIARATQGEEHSNVSAIMNNLAKLLTTRGNYIEAEQIYKQVLVIKRKTVGENHPGFATNLSNLAVLYRELGDYREAEQLLKQALAILSTVFGEDHLELAANFNNLGTLYLNMGHYDKALLFLEKALEIRRKALGEMHPDVAQSLHNLATAYRVMGNNSEGERLYRQALEVARSTLGESHPDLANYLYSLSGVYEDAGNYTEAEALDLEVLEIRREALREKHPLVAQSLSALGQLYGNIGRYAEAEMQFRRATQITLSTVGKEHEDFADLLHKLATLYLKMGNYTEAETRYRESLEIRRKVAGEVHPEVANSLSNLAILCATTGRVSEAMSMMQQVTAIEDQIIGQVFSVVSERQRMAFLTTLQVNFHLFFSLIRHSRAGSPKSALELVLRRKSLGAEVLAAQRDAVLGGHYPNLQGELRTLALLRGQIAQKTLAGPGPEGLEAHQQQLAEWNTQRERLEADLARQLPEMSLRQQLLAADRQAIAQALPPGSALIEFVRIKTFDFNTVLALGRTALATLYVAFVLTAGQPDNVRMIELGDADGIDQRIAAFRASITGDDEMNPVSDLVVQRWLYESPSPTDSTEVDRERHIALASSQPNEDAFLRQGRSLRALVFDPLTTALKGYTRLFLAPDGDLARLPFEVLLTDDGRYLIDNYQISYLGVGRDVLRFGTTLLDQLTPPLVIADPDFDLGIDNLAASKEESRPHEPLSRDLKGNTLHFRRLPGTRVEGQQIATQLEVLPLLERAALELSIKTCRSPRILHIATHGFFLPDQKRDPNKEQLGLRAFGMGIHGEIERLSQGLENPLLRSGLVLAGANTTLQGGAPPPEAEDGFLTAEDVSGLDLFATELVVLSACETGLGEVHVGEGVFGLRRAFVQAGAKTLVMSLWKIPDQHTQELMQDFYRRILGGSPRAVALREAQLAMKAKYPSPYYWGTFICQGDPNPLLR